MSTEQYPRVMLKNPALTSSQRDVTLTKKTETVHRIQSCPETKKKQLLNDDSSLNGT